jgi:hypothetical protein
MKHLIFGSASFLLLVAISMPAMANPTIAVNRQTATRMMQSTTPVNLVSLAYRGYFAAQGIPSYAQFLGALQANRVTAEGLVEGAIASGKLPASTLDDSGYINAVKLQLDG